MQKLRKNLLAGQLSLGSDLASVLPEARIHAHINSIHNKNRDK